MSKRAKSTAGELLLARSSLNWILGFGQSLAKSPETALRGIGAMLVAQARDGLGLPRQVDTALTQRSTHDTQSSE